MLPGFGPENWTSEIRDTFGFQSFEGKSFADFRYEDNTGTLTGILFGEQKKSAWESAWPTYHLEVKTTSETEQEEFYMSKLQCMHVSTQLGACLIG